MSNIIRKITLFLIPVLILQFTSCGLVVINYDKFKKPEETSAFSSSPIGSDTPADDSDSPNIIVNDYSDIIDSHLSRVPDKNYNENVFKITSPDISSICESGNLEFLSEAAAERNRIVSEKHSISIVSSKVDYTVYYEEVNTAVKSGMYYSDLLMLPQGSVAAFAAGGLILNMRSMPALDFDAPYFNKTSVGAAAGGFYSYAIAGPASAYPYSLPAVFFNVDLCASNSTDLYSVVNAGEWTWDKFFEAALLASTNDYTFSWGTANLGDAAYDAAFVSVGQKMINSGIMQVPSLAFDSETSASAVDVLKRLMAEPKALGTNTESLSLFSEGKVLFQIERLSAMSSLRGSSVKWGVLPMPKITSDSSYISLAGEESLMFACPSTVTTPEKSAIILMSLNAASDGPIKDAYINYILYNYLRDNDSANMLDYIIDGTVYDFSYTFGGMYSGIADGTYNVIRKSAFPNENMEYLINRYKGGLDRTLASRFGLSN